MNLEGISLDRPLVFIDLEATGVDPANDRIVQFFAIKFDADQSMAESLGATVNPGMPIPKETSDIHGITDDMVANLDRFSRYAQSLADFMDGSDIAGFNVRRFDVKMLCHEMRRCGVEFKLAGRRIIDVCEIYHHHERRDLSGAVKLYLGKEHSGAHRAEADVLATVEVLVAQIKRYDLPRTTSLLADHAQGDRLDVAGNFVRSKADGRPVFAFGKYSGRSLEDVAMTNKGYLSWFLDQDFLDDAKAIVRAVLSSGVATPW